MANIPKLNYSFIDGQTTIHGYHMNDFVDRINKLIDAVGGDTPTPTPTQVTITVETSPNDGGTVTGGGTYTQGQTVQISATPASGYVFQKWNDNNTSATRTITVGSSAQTYTAIFVLAQEPVTRTKLMTQSRLVRSGSDDTQLKLSTSSSAMLGFYPNTAGSNYLLTETQGASANAFWGYASSIPEGDTISEDTMIAGKLPEQPEATTSQVQINISNSENYPYIVICHTSSGQNTSLVKINS